MGHPRHGEVGKNHQKAWATRPPAVSAGRTNNDIKNVFLFEFKMTFLADEPRKPGETGDGKELFSRTP